MKTVAILALVAAAGVANAQVYSFSGSQTIGDSPVPSATNTIMVPDSFSITDLNVVFKANHTFNADLDVLLIRGSNYVVLSTDNGGSGDNFQNVRFDDSAAASITTAPTTGNINGIFRPEGTIGTSITQGIGGTGQQAATGLLSTAAVANLGFWNGSDALGGWTLWIDDDATGDVGSLLYWSLEFNGVQDPNGPLPPPPPPPPAPAFTGNFTSTPNNLVEGLSFAATTVWNHLAPQAGLTDGCGEGAFPWLAAVGGEFTAVGNEVGFRVEHDGGQFRVDLTGLTTDLDLYVMGVDGLPGNALFSSTAGGTTSEFVDVVLPAGTYYVGVDTFSGEGSAFNLTYIPAPSALALLGLGGVVAGRRRR
jgi:subtilisin-like proprotein convertase family protein